MNINKIKFTFQYVDLRKGEHRTPEFEKISFSKTVPVLKEGEFTLSGSHAIMRFICDTREVADNWFPKDPKKRALVDEYLDWHHSNLRSGVTGQVFKIKFAPMFG